MRQQQQLPGWALNEGTGQHKLCAIEGCRLAPVLSGSGVTRLALTVANERHWLAPVLLGLGLTPGRHTLALNAINIEKDVMPLTPSFKSADQFFSSQ